MWRFYIGICGKMKEKRKQTESNNKLFYIVCFGYCFIKFNFYGSNIRASHIYILIRINVYCESYSWWICLRTFYSQREMLSMKLIYHLKTSYFFTLTFQR